MLSCQHASHVDSINYEQTYDVCKNFGFKWFVVTTYSHWVFGTWSSSTCWPSPLVLQARYSYLLPDWTAAEVTAVLPFDKTQGVTLVEMLVFWTQSGREKVRYWHTPAVSVVSNIPPLQFADRYRCYLYRTLTGNVSLISSPTDPRTVAYNIYLE